MKKYLLALVLSPGLEKEALEKVISKIKKIISDASGKVVKLNEWGKKVLCYTIKKQKEGVYYWLDLEMDSLKARGVDDKIRIEEGVLRHLLVKKE